MPDHWSGASSEVNSGEAILKRYGARQDAGQFLPQPHARLHTAVAEALEAAQLDP